MDIKDFRALLKKSVEITNRAEIDRRVRSIKTIEYVLLDKELQKIKFKVKTIHSIRGWYALEGFKSRVDMYGTPKPNSINGRESKYYLYEEGKTYMFRKIYKSTVMYELHVK